MLLPPFALVVESLDTFETTLPTHLSEPGRLKPILSVVRLGSKFAALASMAQYYPDKWIDQLMRCEHLSEPEMKILCDRVRSILMEESNIQPVSSPVTICGDIHGQFWDLLELLRKGGQVPETSYIFMARRCCWYEIGRRR